MSKVPTDFKEQLIHLHDEFFAYTLKYSTTGVPVKQLVVMLQKYLHVRPTDFCTLLSRSIDSKIITWDKFLAHLQDQIGLRDQMMKLAYGRPSIMSISYSRDPDQHLQQNISSVISYVKTKETNLITRITKAEFLGLSLLAVILGKQIVFYDCKDKKIVKHLQFRYHNVREKIIVNQSSSQSVGSNILYDERWDKVNPISRRTDDYFFSIKSRKNTNNSEDLKNILTNSMKKSKMESSVCSESNDGFRRSVTDMGSISRTATRLNKLASVQKAAYKRPTTKIRSNDTKNIFKILTEASIEGSLELIKAYQHSRETFQKYITIEKSKIEVEKKEEIKAPSSIALKHNYRSTVKEMRQQGKQLNLSKGPSSRKTSKNSRVFRQSKSIKPEVSSISEFLKVRGNDAYSSLQKKVLQIESVSIIDHYLLVSLINREVRLYSFRRTINGFEEELLFEKQFESVVSYVLLYQSYVRKMYNIVIGKLEDQITKLTVYELNSQMKVQNQVYHTVINYAPVFENMLPLGVGGFTEAGNFFLLQLNSPGRIHCEEKTIDTVLVNRETGERVSITCINFHLNLIYLYLGSKDGSIYIYDRFSKTIRLCIQVTKHPIKYLHFLNDSTDLIYWEHPSRVGIVNADTLQISSTHTIDPGYDLLIPYFAGGEFLAYGKRKIGLVSFRESEEKRFNLQKAAKIYDRRERIVKNKDYNALEHLESTQFSSKNRRILSCYRQNCSSLILICSDGEIMIFNCKLEYIGSYFTLNFDTVMQCGTCPTHKYLSLLYENNDIQIANTYSQEIVLTIKLTERVFDVVFCHSAIYFCACLTYNKNLLVYGFENSHKEIAAKVSLTSMVPWPLDPVSHSFKFYKGSMMLINYEEGEICFFMKKTFGRGMTIRCWRGSCLKIKSVLINHQSGTMTLAREDEAIQVYCLDQKTLLQEWTFDTENREGKKIIEHYYSHQDKILNIFWKGETEESFCIYSVGEDWQLKLIKQQKISEQKQGEKDLETVEVKNPSILEKRKGKIFMMGEYLLQSNNDQTKYEVVSGLHNHKNINILDY